MPDLIAYGKLVVDTKVIEQITDHELGQMMNYLKITGLQVGIILNFKQAILEWKARKCSSRSFDVRRLDSNQFSKPRCVEYAIDRGRIGLRLRLRLRLRKA